MKRIIIALTAIVMTSVCCHAQLNTNRIMQIGRNALYFEDYVLSIQYFNRVINVKPYLADPYYYRAIAKFYLDDISGAGKDCDIALDINPFIIGAYNLRGIIRLRKGESEDALSDFTKGLEIEPDNINLLMNCGIANINLNNVIITDAKEGAVFQEAKDITINNLKIETQDGSPAIRMGGVQNVTINGDNYAQIGKQQAVDL
jgi:tetratricopeptide (TPR) repeat protein